MSSKYTLDPGSRLEIPEEELTVEINRGYISGYLDSGIEVTYDFPIPKKSKTWTFAPRTPEYPMDIIIKEAE